MERKFLHIFGESRAEFNDRLDGAYKTIGNNPIEYQQYAVTETPKDRSYYMLIVYIIPKS